MHACICIYTELYRFLDTFLSKTITFGTPSSHIACPPAPTKLALRFQRFALAHHFQAPSPRTSHWGCNIETLDATIWSCVYMIYMYNYNSIHIYTKFHVFHQIQSVLSSTKTVLILVCIRVPYPPGWNGNYRNLKPLGHQKHAWNEKYHQNPMQYLADMSGVLPFQSCSISCWNSYCLDNGYLRDTHTDSYWYVGM